MKFYQKYLRLLLCMLNYNDNTKRCIVCRTKHTWFDLILDSFNSMIRPVSKCLFFLLRSLRRHVSHPTHDAMRPIFPAIVLPVACKYTPLSSIPTARRFSSLFSKWQLVPRGDCMRSYAMVLLQNNADANGPSILPNEIRKEHLTKRNAKLWEKEYPLFTTKSYIFFAL